MSIATDTIAMDAMLSRLRNAIEQARTHVGGGWLDRWFADGDTREFHLASLDTLNTQTNKLATTKYTMVMTGVMDIADWQREAGVIFEKVRAIDSSVGDWGFTSYVTYTVDNTSKAVVDTAQKVIEKIESAALKTTAGVSIYVLIALAIVAFMFAYGYAKGS